MLHALRRTRWWNGGQTLTEPPLLSPRSVAGSKNISFSLLAALNPLTINGLSSAYRQGGNMGIIGESTRR